MPDQPRTLMWEARAAEGHAADLLAWLLAAVPRGQVFRSADRVVLVLDLDGGTSDAVPEPPVELVARPPHAWRFEQVRSS